MAAYDAFISYNHAKDKPIAAVLQSVIQKLGKPWYRRRAVRVFRDDTSMSATPGLWPSVERALANSRFMILFASPEAAASQWVNKEVSYWLDYKSVDTILIALTHGELAWDNTVGDFVWREGMPLPPVLTGRFASEPKWVDLRAYRDGANPRDSRFIEAGADFAATIRGMPREDLLSQEVRQQRRALQLAYSGAATLAVLMALAIWQWRVAVSQRDLAEQTLNVATNTANGLIFDLADRFTNTAGIPASLIGDVLERARRLQDELTGFSLEGNDALRQRFYNVSPQVRYSSAAALLAIQATLLRQGDTKAALESAERARKILADLVAKDPSNVEWQRALSSVYGRIAEVLLAQGKREEALAMLARGSAIGLRLANADPANAHLQLDLAIQHSSRGDALLSMGRFDEASEAFRVALDTIRKIAQRDPGNVRWQQALGVAYYRNGEATLIAAQNADQSQRQTLANDALENFRSSLEIRQQLADGDPDNTEWMDDIASTYFKIGEAHSALNEDDAAVDWYQESLAIITNLRASDPGNARWLRFFGIAQTYIGDALVAGHKPSEAIEAYRQALAVAEQLAALDPNNAGWQSDLGILLVKLALAGDDPQAQLARGTEILRRLRDTGRMAAHDLRWIEIADSASSLPR